MLLALVSGSAKAATFTVGRGGAKEKGTSREKEDICDTSGR